MKYSRQWVWVTFIRYVKLKNRLLPSANQHRTHSNIYITIQTVRHRVDWFSCLAFVLLQYTPARRPNVIFYSRLHVDGDKFHYRRPNAAVRPQVVHRCAKSYRLHNWYNCPSKPFATSHAYTCFLLWKSHKSRTMLTALTFTAKSTSAAHCTSPTRDAEVHGLVVRPITATSRVCFQSCATRSLVWLKAKSSRIG